VECRLHSQVRHCIVLMINRKSFFFGLGAHEEHPQHFAGRISLIQLLLDEENPKIAGKQEEDPELIFVNGSRYRARYNRQWVADKAQCGEKFNSLEGDVYTGDNEQHGGCVEEWPDSMFVPGLFQREDWPDSIFSPGHFQRQ